MTFITASPLPVHSACPCCVLQKYPLPGIGADGAEQAILDEFDDARETVHGLSEEYKACENDNYIDGVTTGPGHSGIQTQELDRRIPAN